ncbi:hypothetical protein SDC9_132191 [bioreactor metagenome]|uniref:Uncharacterized protein n=1 Tax=bioreactor metagenome TaxID=1076179 RepID=A0A645D6Z0_9ZZZZ
MLLNTFNLVDVDMAVAASPNKIAGLEVALLGHHESKQGILSDVENQSYGRVGTALIQKAGKSAFGNVELKQCVA